MKKRMLIAAAGLGMLVLSMPVSAMDVTISGEACPLNVYPSPDGTAASEVTSVTELEVCGIVSGYVSVSIDGVPGYVNAVEFSEKLPAIPVGSLPDGTSYENITQGTNGDGAKKVQEQLISLGYLTGPADGQYGPGSAQAVTTFQTEHRMEGTGIADVNTQMMLDMLTGGLPDVMPVTYPSIYSADDKFSSISGETDADLDKYTDGRWLFQYDSFKSFGTLNPNIHIGIVQVETPDIDRISLDASLQVVITRNKKSRLIFRPCLVVESEGAYRPYLQSVTLTGGDGKTVTCSGGASDGGVEGAALTEFGYVPLSDDAMSLLAEGSVTAFRISGMNKDYDIQVTENQDQLAWFGQNA